MTNRHDQREHPAGQNRIERAEQRPVRPQPCAHGAQQFHVSSSHPSEEEYRQEESYACSPAGRTQTKPGQSARVNEIRKGDRGSAKRHDVRNSSRSKIDGRSDSREDYGQRCRGVHTTGGTSPAKKQHRETGRGHRLTAGVPQSSFYEPPTCVLMLLNCVLSALPMP